MSVISLCVCVCVSVCPCAHARQDVEAVPMPDGQLCLLTLPPECCQGEGPEAVPYLKLFCRYITDCKVSRWLLTLNLSLKTKTERDPNNITLSILCHSLYLSLSLSLYLSAYLSI